MSQSEWEYLHVLLIRAAEVDVDEPPNLRTKTVRAVLRCRDGLRRGSARDRLEEDDAVVGEWQAARGGHPRRARSPAP